LAGAGAIGGRDIERPAEPSCTGEKAAPLALTDGGLIEPLTELLAGPGACGGITSGPLWFSGRGIDPLIDTVTLPEDAALSGCDTDEALTTLESPGTLQMLRALR
jgi:hypothetical protein